MTPTIAVVGPGAIGTTVAAALHETGRTPLLAGRTPRDSLELRDAGRSVVIPGPVRLDPDLVAPVDLVFLAVKATQLDGAAPWLAALCRTETVVCVLQNGVEQTSMVASLVPGSAVVPSVVWFPAVAQPDGSVLLRGEPRLSIPDVPAAATVRDAFRGSRVAVDVAADFTSVAWRKLLQNAAAGLMALTGRRSGMYRRDDVARVTLAYLGECLAVARAEGAVLGDVVPQELLDAFRANAEDLGTRSSPTATRTGRSSGTSGTASCSGSGVRTASRPRSAISWCRSSPRRATARARCEKPLASQGFSWWAILGSNRYPGRHKASLDPAARRCSRSRRCSTKGTDAGSKASSDSAVHACERRPQSRNAPSIAWSARSRNTATTAGDVVIRT